MLSSIRHPLSPTILLPNNNSKMEHAFNNKQQTPNTKHQTPNAKRQTTNNKQQTTNNKRKSHYEANYAN